MEQILASTARCRKSKLSSNRRLYLVSCCPLPRDCVLTLLSYFDTIVPMQPLKVGLRNLSVMHLRRWNDYAFKLFVILFNFVYPTHYCYHGVMFTMESQGLNKPFIWHESWICSDLSSRAKRIINIVWALQNRTQLCYIVISHDLANQGLVIPTIGQPILQQHDVYGVTRRQSCQLADSLTVRSLLAATYIDTCTLADQYHMSNFY